MKEIAVAARASKSASPRRRSGNGVDRASERDSTGVEVIAKVDAVLSILEQRGETSAADIAELDR